jgi:hypothetical protein
MLKFTIIGVTAALLSLAGLTAASADIPDCLKAPNADTCPTFGSPSPATSAPNYGQHRTMRHGRYYRTAPAYQG